ncbi:protein yfbM, partial [Shigella flexneri 1235-66]
MGMIGYFAEIDSEKINQLLESTEKPLMDNIHDTLSGLRRLESLDRSELRKQFSIKRLNEMEIYPGVTFSEELEGQLFASIMLDMEKLISAYRRMLRQGNH